ncbi:MAG: multidrug effflux MFS transporter [Candidatus Moduliflexus flocculans]|nr:multidrug effflux MFS transporter [Candidatus Moduliflexus flocculans]
MILGALIAFAPMSIDMYLPSLPTISAEFGTEPAAAQFTLASFFIGLALGQAFHGPLADRFGRKPPLYAGLALYVAASVGCALAPDIATLTVLRFVQAVGGCAGVVIARAVVRDRFDARTSARVYSLLMLVMGLAPILAPFAGGWILALAGWRAIFAVLALLGLACLLATWRYLPETRPADTFASHGIGATLRVYAELLRDRGFLGYALSRGFAQAGMFAYITGSPHVFIELYEVPAQAYGWLFGLNALGLIASSQLNRRLLLRHSADAILRRANRTTVLLGLGLLAVAASGWGGLPALLIPLFGYLASLGFTAPNAWPTALAHQGARAGGASALIGTCNSGWRRFRARWSACWAPARRCPWRR